ncbi:Actin-like protein 10 [Perkinsus olseni]|uniref:Actin-like protein 10 n=1 Tax=Perkinsus olseni TaxID=32597 RepID=A0A7J6LF98_PEROL|nr:Actin-like protein 10 [Perkinsus olseni]
MKTGDASDSSVATKVIAIDNGGGLLKAGLVDSEHEEGALLYPEIVIPNAVARARRGGKAGKNKVLVGKEIMACPEYTMTRPSHKGIVIDWETQKILWDGVLHGGRRHLPGLLSKGSDLSDVTVIVSQPLFCPVMVTRVGMQVLFEDFAFARAVFVDSPLCLQFSESITSQFGEDEWKNPCGLIVDAGFSGCRAVPVYNTYPLERCAQRMDVGGRVMTNYLKEAIAYNKVDLDDAPLLVEHIRENMCYSAQDFVAEVEASRTCPGETTRRYILPDHSSTSSHLGRVVDPRLGEDVSSKDFIDMNHERMVACEALWQPGSIGILQAGLAEMAARAVMKAPVATRSAVAKKVILGGGLFLIPGVLERFKAELQSNLPVEIASEVKFFAEEDGRYDLSVWRGLHTLGSSEEDLAHLGLFNRDTWLAAAKKASPNGHPTASAGFHKLTRPRAEIARQCAIMSSPFAFLREYFTDLMPDPSTCIGRCNTASDVRESEKFTDIYSYRSFCHKACAADESEVRDMRGCEEFCLKLCFRDNIVEDTNTNVNYVVLERSPGSPENSAKCMEVCTAGCGFRFSKGGKEDNAWR